MFDPSFTSTKHTFVCDPDECDTLVEITTSDRFGFPSGAVQNTCPCGRQMSLVSSTIESNPTIERQIKTVDLEYKLDELRRVTDRLNNLQSTVNQVIDNLNADGWYNPNFEKVEVLNELCEILGHEPKQSIRITATITVDVDYEIPLEEVEDFDARYFLQDNLSIDSWHGDVSVDSWSVEDHDVDWKA